MKLLKKYFLKKRPINTKLTFDNINLALNGVIYYIKTDNNIVFKDYVKKWKDDNFNIKNLDNKIDCNIYEIVERTY